MEDNIQKLLDEADKWCGAGRIIPIDMQTTGELVRLIVAMRDHISAINITQGNNMDVKDTKFVAVCQYGEFVQSGWQHNGLKVDGKYIPGPNFITLNAYYTIDGVRHEGIYKESEHGR